MNQKAGRVFKIIWPRKTLIKPRQLYNRINDATHLLIMESLQPDSGASFQSDTVQPSQDNVENILVVDNITTSSEIIQADEDSFLFSDEELPDCDSEVEEE
jgi:hypothetical protein